MYDSDSIGLQEDVLGDEQNSQNVHQRADLLSLAGEQVQSDIGDDAPADTLGDGVGFNPCPYWLQV